MIDQAAKAARLGARPLDNTDLTNSWRRRMVEVYVRRALRELAGLPITDYDIQVASHQQAVELAGLEDERRMRSPR